MEQLRMPSDGIPSDLILDIFVLFGLAASSYPKLNDLQRQTRSIGSWHGRQTWVTYIIGYLAPAAWCWSLYTKTYKENIVFLIGFVMLGIHVLIHVLPRLPPTEVLIDFQFCHCLWTAVMQVVYCLYFKHISVGVFSVALLPMVSHGYSLWNQEHTYFNVSKVRACHHTAILFAVVSLFLPFINISECCPELLSPPIVWQKYLPVLTSDEYSIPTVSSAMRYYRWVFLAVAAVLSMTCVYLWRMYTSYIVKRIIRLREEQDAEDGVIPGVNTQDVGTAKKKKLKKGRGRN